MTPRQTIRAIHALADEIMAANSRRDDAAELEVRGLMEFRTGAWRITSAGRRFIRDNESE